MLMVTQMSCLMLTALAAAASPVVPDLKLSAPLEQEPDETRLRPHLFLETLRVPFGDDWGGETFMFTPVGQRLSLGLFMRAWSEGICDPLACTERAIETGVELRYRVKPGVDMGMGIGVQKGAAPRSVPAIMPRIHLKF